MSTLPTGLQKLIALLARLPGIGERTATRLAFHALSEPDGYAGRRHRLPRDGTHSGSTTTSACLCCPYGPGCPCCISWT